MKIYRVLILLLVICAVSISSCAEKPNESSEVDTTPDPYAGFNDWSDEMEAEIKQAYWMMSHIDLSGFKADELPMYYFGVYSGYAVVLPNGVANDVVIDKTVGGYEFKYGNSNIILMYKDGAFAYLEDVFAEGKITKDDLDLIYEKYMSTKANP